MKPANIMQKERTKIYNDDHSKNDLKIANMLKMKRFKLYSEGKGKYRLHDATSTINPDELEQALHNMYKIVKKRGLGKSRQEEIDDLASMDVRPLTNEDFEIVEDDDPNNEKQQEVLDKIANKRAEGYKKDKRFIEAARNEDEAWNKVFNKLLDKAIDEGLKEGEKLNKSKGVNKMDLYEATEKLAELYKADTITMKELQDSERDIQKGIPLSNRIEELLLGRTNKKRNPPPIDEEDIEDEKHERMLKEDENDETEYAERRKKQRREVVPRRNYGSAAEKAMITNELTELCKSNQITLGQLTKAETCINKGVKFSMIPDDNNKIENLMSERFEFEDEDSEEDFEDDEGMDKADTVLGNLKTGKREDYRTKRPDASRSDEDAESFNKYFGLSHVELMGIVQDLHRAGEVSIEDVMDSERLSQRGLELPFRVLRKLKKEIA